MNEEKEQNNLSEQNQRLIKKLEDQKEVLEKILKELQDKGNMSSIEKDNNI